MLDADERHHRASQNGSDSNIEGPHPVEEPVLPYLVTHNEDSDASVVK